MPFRWAASRVAGPPPRCGRARPAARLRRRRPRASGGNAPGSRACQRGLRGQVDGMKRAARTAYVCQQCGHAAPRWLGQCPSCESWGTLVEEAMAETRATAAAAAPPPGQAPQALSAVTASETIRRSTGVGELDRVLGGGLVQGSIVLLGGDPGIG